MSLTFHELVEAGSRCPVDGMCWAPWAREFMADMSRFVLVLGGNQVGKTYGMCGKLIHLIRGTGPYADGNRPWEGPLNIALYSESMEQMSMEGAILEKLWSMLPKDEIDPKVTFERGYGIRGLKNPAIRFVSGPGAGTVIRIKSYSQQVSKQAGFSGHVVLLDEPPTSALLEELKPRVRANRGCIWISFTPVPGMPDQSALREEVEEKLWSVHKVKTTEANCWPEGYPRPFYSAEFIAEEREKCSPMSRSMRFDAAWSGPTDQWLPSFSDDVVVPFELRDIPSDNVVVVGTDYGLKPGKQASVFIAVSDPHSDRPKVWVFDEYQPDGYSRVEQNAEGILDVLSVHGMTYFDVDEWVGDQAAMRGHRVARKSNLEMRRELARLAGITMDDPRSLWIHAPTKYANSAWDGFEMLDTLMQRGDLLVHPRCKNVIEAKRRFRGGKNDPSKDVLDAERYAVERVCQGRIVVPMRGRYVA